MHVPSSPPPCQGFHPGSPHLLPTLLKQAPHSLHQGTSTSDPFSMLPRRRWFQKATLNGSLWLTRKKIQGPEQSLAEPSGFRPPTPLLFRIICHTKPHGAFRVHRAQRPRLASRHFRVLPSLPTAMPVCISQGEPSDAAETDPPTLHLILHVPRRCWEEGRGTPAHCHRSVTQA